MKRTVISMLLVLTMVFSLAVPAVAAGNGITPAKGHEVLAKLPATLQRPARPTTLEQAVGRTGNFYPCDWVLSQSKASVFQEIVALTDSLTAGKTSDREKAKAIYDWTSQNITYDQTAYDYWIRQERGEWLTEDKVARIDHASDPFYVYAQKLAICGGYADLTWLMLSIAQIPSATVTGTARTGGPHAWNAVLLDGTWLFFDPTWKEWDMAPDYHTSSEGIAFCDGVFQQVMGGEENSTSYYLCRGFECPANVVMPEGCFDVMAESFKDCTTLKSITLPSTCTAIETSAFQGCTGLTGITIPAKVEYVNWNSFKDCSNLQNVTFLGRTEVREGAFDGTPMVENAKELAIVGGVLVKYKGSAREVTIPVGVTAIAEKAFDLNLYLNKVVIPEGVTSIGTRAFRQCSALTDVTIPKSVTAIGNDAFYETPWLKKQGDFPIFGGILLAYQGADVAHIVVPDGVREISAGAFRTVSSARRITLPASLTKIGAKVFSHTYLEEVYFGGTKAQWDAVEIVPDGGTNWKFRDEETIVHCSGASTANIAYTSTQTVEVDGREVIFACYALKDETGAMTNYIKLRDLAIHLNGTAAQFQVGWDGDVTITTQTAYTPNGSELSTPFSGNRPYKDDTAATKVNGEAADFATFVLNDDAGGGYTYYQLRDLGKALGFNVGWSGDRGIFLETDKPYDSSN